MKTLKTILEGYPANSGDEKRFIDKHVVVKHADRNGNGDDVFKAKKTKYIKRKEEGHGHDAGEDHLVYEDVEDLAESLKTRLVDMVSSAVGVDHYETIQKAAKKFHDNAMKEVKTRFPEGHPKHEAAKTLVRAVHAHIADSKNLTDMEHRTKNIGKTMAAHVQKLQEEAEDLNEHRGYKATGLEAAGYKFVSHSGAGSNREPSTLYKHEGLDKHIEIVHEKTGIKGAKKRHAFFSGKYAGGMQTRHLNLDDAIRKNAGKLNEDTIDEAKRYNLSKEKLEAGRKSTEAKQLRSILRLKKRTNSDGKWASKDVREEVLDEATTVDSKKYTWGTMKTVRKGNNFSIPLHPEHHEPIAKLKDGESHDFTDETRTRWKAARNGDDVHFSSSAGKVSVPHSKLNEEGRVPSHMYSKPSKGPVNPSAMAGSHHTTPEQRRAAKLKRSKDTVKEEAEPTNESVVKKAKRILKGWGGGTNVASTKDDTDTLSTDSLKWSAYERKTIPGTPADLQRKLAARKLKNLGVKS